MDREKVHEAIELLSSNVFSRSLMSHAHAGRGVKLVRS